MDNVTPNPQSDSPNAAASVAPSPASERSKREVASAPGTPALALFMDVLGVALFALFARIAHQTEEMPLNFSGWMQTVWPFLLGAVAGWVLLTLTGKVARATALSSGVIVWLCTAIAGLTIWGIRHGEIPHWSFIIVASVMSGLLLLGWRAITGKRAGRAARGVKK
ncbi:DUF3054 domain-containing protein [Corynebacterium resistens]|uniref:DUF3054 domain-containing protein n=1 Tax=Corynebacterium resistens TaxID=258224 RepID=UPI0030B80D3D